MIKHPFNSTLLKKPYTLSGYFRCVLLVCVPLSSNGMWRFHHNVHNPLSWNFAQLLLIVTNISCIFQNLWHNFFRHNFSSCAVVKPFLFQLLWNGTYLTNILHWFFLCVHCELKKKLCLSLSVVIFSRVFACYALNWTVYPSIGS